MPLLVETIDQSLLEISQKQPHMANALTLANKPKAVLVKQCHCMMNPCNPVREVLTTFYMLSLWCDHQVSAAGVASN